MAGNAPAGKPFSASPGASARGGPLAWPALLPLGHHNDKPPIPLMRPVTIVGSRQNAHLHLLSRQISKAHAILISFSNQVYIRDLASRTHVYVNGEEVREADLFDGDLVKLGSFTFKFQAAAGMKQRARPDETPPGILAVGDGDVSLPVEQRVVLIGRRENCDVSLVEESVSTGHAVLFTMGGNRFIRDLGSRTGTWVNGRKEKQIELKFGDTIRIGETTFRYEAVPASEAAPVEVDEFEDLVGTAPLVDSSLSDATPAAPLPQSFDSSSAQGRAGKAVASDPLAADNLDFDLDLPDEPRRGDTAVLPAIEAIAPTPPAPVKPAPAKPSPARPTAPARRAAPIPLAALEADPIAPAAEVTVPLSGRPLAPVSQSPVLPDSGQIPLDIDEPRLLIGENLLREKLSSSGTGSGMDAAAREAMGLAGHPRRQSAPQAPAAKRPAIAPPAVRAPQPPIPVDDEPLELGAESPIPIHVDDELILPEIEVPIHPAAEEPAGDIDESMFPVTEEPTVSEEPAVAERHDAMFPVEEPAIAVEQEQEYEHPAAIEQASSYAGFDESVGASVVEEPIEDLVDAPISPSHHEPLEPVVEESAAVVEEPPAPDVYEPEPLAIHDLGTSAVEDAPAAHHEEPLPLEHESAWPTSEESVADASEFTAPVVEEPIAPLIDEPISAGDSHEIPPIEEPVIAELGHVEPLAEESINAAELHEVPPIAEPTLADQGHIGLVVEEPIAPLIDEPITQIAHEPVDTALDEAMVVDGLSSQPTVDPAADFRHEPAPDVVPDQVPHADQEPFVPTFEHEAESPADETVSPPVPSAIAPLPQEDLALPLDDTIAPSPIETGVERAPADEELLELGDPLPTGGISGADDGLLAPLDPQHTAPPLPPAAEAPRRRWFGWLRKPKTTAENKGVEPAPSMRIAPAVPIAPLFEPTLVDDSAAPAPAPVDQSPEDRPADLASVLEPLAGPVEPPTHAGERIAAEEEAFAPTLAEEELDLSPFEVSAQAADESTAGQLPAVTGAVFDLPVAHTDLPDVSRAVPLEDAAHPHEIPANVPAHHGQELALDELADDDQASESEALDAAEDDRHLAVEADVLTPHDSSAADASHLPIVEVVEPAQPTVDSVMEVGHSVGVPADALDLSAPLVEPAESLSDTAFDLQVEAFAAESLDPIVVTPQISAESSAPTTPTHHLDAATHVEPIAAPPLSAAPLAEAHDVGVAPPAAAPQEVLAGGDFQPPDTSLEDDFLFPLDEPTPPTPEAFPTNASFEHGSFAATAPAVHEDEPAARETVAPPAPSEPVVAFMPPLELSPAVPIEAAEPINEAPADLTAAPSVEEYQPTTEPPSIFEDAPSMPHAEADLLAAPVHSDWDESLTGWDVSDEAEHAAQEAPLGSQAADLGNPVADTADETAFELPHENPVAGDPHAVSPAIEVEPPAITNAPTSARQTGWSDAEGLADLELPSEFELPAPALPLSESAPSEALPAHDPSAEQSFVTEDVTEPLELPSEFDVPSVVEPIAQAIHAPIEVESSHELPPAEPSTEELPLDELPDEQIVDRWTPEASPEIADHFPPLEQVDSIADLERSLDSEDHLASLEPEADISPPVAESPFFGDPTSDSGAALHPQRPVTGIGNFDLGTDQASFLGGLPLILSDLDHSDPAPPPLASQAAAPAPAPQTPPDDESGAILDMDFGPIDEPLDSPNVPPFMGSAAPAAPPMAEPSADLLEELPAPEGQPAGPRKTLLSSSKAPAPGRRPRSKPTPFGTGTPASDLPSSHAGFGAPAEIFGGLAASGGTIDVFSQGMSADLSNDPFFGTAAKEPARKKRKPPQSPVAQSESEFQSLVSPPAPEPEIPFTGGLPASPAETAAPFGEAPAESRKPLPGRRAPAAPPVPDEAAEHPELDQPYTAEPAEPSEEDSGAPPFAPPAEAPFEEDEFLAPHEPSRSFAQAEPVTNEEPSPRNVDQQPPAARGSVTIPAGHRRRGKGIAILLLLMLLLMAASFVAIYGLLKQRHVTTGRLPFENLDQQPAEQARIFQIGQVALLAKPQTQDTAKRIFKQDNPGLDYGFLDNVIDFSKNDSPQRAHWSDTNPSELVFRYEGFDPGDKARVQSVLSAVCTLDTAIRDEALQADRRRNKLKHELELEIQKQDQLLADYKSLQSARDLGPDTGKIAALEKELAAAEQNRRATWDASIAAEAELKQIEAAHATGAATNPTGTVAASVTVVAPADADLDALQKQMDSATGRLEAARKTAAEQAEMSRKSLDAAIEQFQQSMNSVQAMMKDSPELSNYVTTTRRLLETSHQLSSDLLGRQQRIYDDLLEMKKAIDTHTDGRRKELYDTDKEIKRLKDQLAMHERGLNAALNAGLDAEAAQIQKEIDDLFVLVSKRKEDLEGDPTVRELKGVSEQLKGKVLALRTQLETDRKQSEAKLTELEKNLQNSAEVQKLPEAQKVLAGQLTARIDSLTAARNSYSKSMEERTAETNAGLQFLEDQVHELSLKVERRKTLLASHDQEQMTAEQKEKHDSEVAAKRAALVDAMKARADAENIAFEKSKELSSAQRASKDAKAALASLLGKDSQLATLRQSIEQKQEELAGAPPAKPFPKLPIMGETENLDDQRPKYTAMALGGIAVIFSSLILAVAVRGDRPQSVMPLPQSQSYAAAPRGSALA